MHAKTACLVASCRHDTTFSIVANRYWLAFQLWIVALLNSGKELVHIYMNNLHLLLFFHFATE